jgi:hypothetical protein
MVPNRNTKSYLFHDKVMFDIVSFQEITPPVKDNLIVLGKKYCLITIGVHKEKRGDEFNYVL